MSVDGDGDREALSSAGPSHKSKIAELCNLKLKLSSESKMV